MKHSNRKKEIIVPASYIIGTLIFLFLFIGGVSFYVFILRPKQSLSDFSNPYPFVDPARSIIAQEHFLPTLEPLRKEINPRIAEYERQGYTIGLYFEYLNTGANIIINGDTRFWPASLSKMPTVFATMKKVEDEKWKLSDELMLVEKHKDSRFGELYKEPEGTLFSIEELIKETLVNSDNTAHAMLLNNLSQEDYTNMFQALGMEELFDKNYDITPREYSRIFRSLYTSSYLSRVSSQKILSYLAQTPFDELLGQGIPKNVPFSHKIGEEFQQSVFLDSGIVYVENRPYLITAMVKTPNQQVGFEGARKVMKDISEIAYKFVSSQ